MCTNLIEYCMHYFFKYKINTFFLYQTTLLLKTYIKWPKKKKKIEKCLNLSSFSLHNYLKKILIYLLDDAFAFFQSCNWSKTQQGVSLTIVCRLLNISISYFVLKTIAKAVRNVDFIMILIEQVHKTELVCVYYLATNNNCFNKYIFI